MHGELSIPITIASVQLTHLPTHFDVSPKILFLTETIAVGSNLL